MFGTSSRANRRLLRPDQLHARRFVEQHNYQALLAMDPGVGKTIVAIRAVKPFVPGLIICRRDDFLTWKIELMDEGFAESEIYSIDYSSQTRKVAGEKVVDEVMLPDPMSSSYKWYMVTYDLVKVPRIFGWVKDSMFGFVIADECQMIKRWKSDRTKAVYHASRNTHHRIGMTGSPITQDPKDLYAIDLFIENGRTFGKSEYLFFKRYYVQDNNRKWHLKKKVKDSGELSKKLGQFAFSMDIDSVIRLAKPEFVVKALPMSGVQMRYTNSLIEAWEVELQNGQVIEYDQVIVQVQKLKQVASGFIYDEEKKPHYMRCPKFDLFCDMLEDKDYFGGLKKLVVWHAYTSEIERLIKHCTDEGIPFVPFFGRMGRKSREQSRLSFRDDPKIKLFIAQEDMGVGMNELVVAHTAAYFSHSIKVQSRQQSMARTRRRGSEHHKTITYWDFVSEGSIEVGQLRAVKRGVNFAAGILSRLRENQGVKTSLDFR